jgi:hypothetical protein
VPPIEIEPVVSGGGGEGPAVDDGVGGNDCVVVVVVVAIKSNNGHCRVVRLRKASACGPDGLGCTMCHMPHPPVIPYHMPCSAVHVAVNLFAKIARM